MHKWIFWGLLFLLPIQLGRHFWPEFAFIFGIRVDYLSPTVYLTDIIVLVLLVSWAFEVGGTKWITPLRQGFAGQGRLGGRLLLTPLILLFLLFPSILTAQNQGAAIYKSAKVLEFFLLGVYIYSNSSWILKTRMFSLPLSLAIIYSSTIAVLQFLKQETLGGVFWFLGERTFTTNTPGITLESLFDQEFLRPYSIFPHPNVLAGFLLVSVLLLYPWRRFIEKIAFAGAASVIALAFSQGVWITVFVILCFWLTRKRKAIFGFLSGLLAGGVILATLLPVLVPPSVSINLPEAFKMRHELAFAAGQMIKNSPLFGVGLNNFINRLPEYGLSPTVSWWLQPVHNVWLLIVAETGSVGLGVFLLLVWHVWRKIGNWKLEIGNLHLALLAIFITGTFDHYWFTLQQTQILAAIVFAIILAYTRKTNVPNNY